MPAPRTNPRGGQHPQPRRRPISLLLLLLAVALLGMVGRAAAAPRIKISDDLDDIVDNEEDEEFAAWGRRKVKEEPDDMMDGGIPMDPNGGMPDVSALLKEGPGRYCSPRHPTHFEVRALVS